MELFPGYLSGGSYVKIGIGVALTYALLKKSSGHRSFVYLKQAETGEYPPIPGYLPENFNGSALNLLAFLSNTRLGDFFLNKIILKAIGVEKLRALKLECGPTFFPIWPHGKATAKIGDEPDISGALNAEKSMERSKNKFCYRTAPEYVRAYKEGKLTPVDVAYRIIDFIEETNDEMRALCDWRKEYILAQASESAKRYLSNSTLSPLDGTFAVVKDHVTVKGMTSRYGLSFLNKVWEEDSPMVEKMKNKGIIIVGMSHMTQLGMSVFGANPSELHGTCRNPVNPDYYPGASSSGTASAICSGMVPFGIGTDGGGSIRMPSSMTGIFGLKTTFGRIPTNGNVPGEAPKGTVSVAGPMACSMADLALFYTVISGPHEGDVYSHNQTPVSIPKVFSPYLDGVKIGVDWTWAKMATPEVYRNFESQIKNLENAGAKIISIEVPEVQLINVGHIVTISCEGAEVCREHIAQNRDMAPDNYVILNAALSQAMADDYILSARLRTRVMQNLNEIFSKVDAIATPTTGQTAEPILAGDEKGTWKFPATLRCMMYVKIANYSGIPAISVPSGYDSKNLPTGLMVHSTWFDEELLIKIGYVAEQHFNRQKPMVYTDLLA